MNELLEKIRISVERLEDASTKPDHYLLLAVLQTELPRLEELKYDLAWYLTTKSRKIQKKT